MAMEFCIKQNNKNRKLNHQLCRHQCRPLPILVLVLVLTFSSWFFVFSPRSYGHNSFTNTSLMSTIPNTQTHPHYNSSSSSSKSGPYHDWQLFAADFEEMMRDFKIYVYPHVYNNTTSEEAFAGIFLPHPNPLNPKIGNYLSEHMFKLSLLGSSLITTIPQQAHFFFLPFSINSMRNDRRIRSEAAIAEFVAQYTRKISSQFPFWNASTGADHFYVCCHSVGRDAASKHSDLHNNAVQVTCSSSYFQKLYVSHKDVSLPQVWPRPLHVPLNPPHARDRLVYFSGRIQNSYVRQELIALWGNDTSMDVFDKSPYPYEEGFRRSKYCLHVKGYEVNTARVSDAIHYGCIPVILSNYYDLPFSNVLDWTKFSVIINTGEIPFLKKRLLSITRQKYLTMYHNLCQVRRHFVWHEMPRGYDSFYMTAYQLWLRTSVNRLSY
ncbi:hypothetical protein Dsin_000850 [Dipteronia sinensis]|uniref:Exostosin GT47 domain-containing protein n=1 Tax=Dipteronia sinensis TaxID=43782 RepID=A0AAE0EI65_9ROSI|nr:hypothetical protein Dsin_000850 [Dipteronia sinensis]